MAVTEEQKRRAEANRLAALEKRKRLVAGPNTDSWRLSKCQRLPSPPPPPPPDPEPPLQPVRFRAVLEICAPDEFSVSTEPLNGFPFPGSIDCLQHIQAVVSPVTPFHAIEGQGWRAAAVYKLGDYELVSKCIKRLPGVELVDIPYTTRMLVQKFVNCVGGRWEPDPSLAGFYSDEEVEEYMGKLPSLLRDVLLPFQVEGVRFALRRGGRCLIADEMGLGKTIQAIAISCCFMDRGPILIVCPAVLRYSWAEELEHWLPFLLPRDIHLVFGHTDSLDRLEKSPKVVVVSYTMLSRLRESMLKREWALMIVDESHNIRTSKKKSEPLETKAMIEMSKSIDRIILLSGTPSLSRPYDIYNQINILWPRALGKDKDEFANNYCLIRLCQGHRAQTYKDYSKGIRLEELNVLLSQTVMIRRLKDHVLTQLPPKRRQIIELELRQSDILLATTSCRIHNEVCMDEEYQNEFEVTHCPYQVCGGTKNPSSFNENIPDNKSEVSSRKLSNQEVGINKSEVISRKLSNQEIGIAKLSGFREWFSNLATIRDSEDTNSLDNDAGFSKMIIFAHHLKVLDGIQEIICEKDIQFVRIDGGTLARDRQAAVEAFHFSAEVKVVIIGITAGGVGLDFSSAQNVVFLELPKSASEMLQAEDRAHRHGQTNAVNIYIFCAKDTPDEPHWMHLNKSMFRVSSMMNGSDYAIEEIEVDRVLYLDHTSNSQAESEEMAIADKSNNGNSGNDVEQKVADKISSVEMDPLKSEADKVFYPDLDQLSGMYENMKDTDNENKHIGQFSISKCSQDKENIQPDFVGNVELKADTTKDKMPIDVDIGADMLTKTGSDNPNGNELLRFEVSRYTRRIHLYICIQGKDSRPRPLFQSFRPEELDSLLYSTGCTTKGSSLCILKENPTYYNIFQKFIKEWNDLRPIEQNKLLGKPLQLPIRLELCYIHDTINHDCGGLLKGGSKRRNTPLSDISHPLPENAFWKKVALRGGLSKEKVYSQAWTVSGEALCKLCQEPCTGILAKTPEFFEDLFCNLSCSQEYRTRTSRSALREALFQIERGVCTQCKLDCHKLVQLIKPLSVKRRQEYILKVAPKWVSKRKLLLNLVNCPTEGNAWHADHIIPVHNGGGECGLENMRTLCVACHSDVTVDQRAELRLSNKRYKELVESFRKKKEVSSNSEHTDSTADKKTGGSDEESLFVTVPGSSYSREICEVTSNHENENSTRE